MRREPTLTLAEAARVLEVDESVVLRWGHESYLQMTRTTTGALRFKESDVLTFLERERELIGEVTQREEERRDRLRRLETYADWVIGLDVPGNQERRLVTLDRIIRLARQAKTGRVDS